MSHLQYFTYPGFGEQAKEATHYSQAVRIGNQIKISGQGGWFPTSNPLAFPPTISEQIKQAFSNVEHTLLAAGSRGFPDVYAVKIYILGPELENEETMTALQDTMKTAFGKKDGYEGHYPILTGIGVASLALGSQVEVEVKAVLKE